MNKILAYDEAQKLEHELLVEEYFQLVTRCQRLEQFPKRLLAVTSKEYTLPLTQLELKKVNRLLKDHGVINAIPRMYAKWVNDLVQTVEAMLKVA